MNSLSAREDFYNAAEIFRRTFFPQGSIEDAISQFKLTQSTIRLEQPLAANNNRYLFQVMDNQMSQTAPGIFNTEIRLRMQDTFVPTHVGMFIGLPASTIDTTWRWYSYPNQFVFANALQMRALWNGQLKIQVQNYQYVYNWDLQRHWASKQTQQTAAFGAGSPEDQNQFDDDGFYPMQPYVLFGGSQNVQPEIILPQGGAPTAVDANSRMLLVFRGVLAQNSTPVT